MSVSFGEEEPVAAPGDVAADGAGAGNFNDEGTFGAPTGYIGDGDFTVFVQGGSNDANGSFNAVLAGTDAAHVRESSNEANGTVAAHAQVTYVVEEDDAGNAGTIGRFEKRCADNHVRAARFVDDGGTEGVMLFAKHVQSFGYCAPTEVRPPIDDNASGFATSVRIYDGNTSHGRFTQYFAVFSLSRQRHAGQGMGAVHFPEREMIWALWAGRRCRRE